MVGSVPVLRFVIPAVPPSLNVWSRGHWSKRASMVSEWHGLIAMFCTAPRCFTVRKDAPPARVTLSFVTRKDGDNCAKAVMDSLVHRGLLSDDGPRGVSNLTLEARACHKGESESTTVCIEYPESGQDGVGNPDPDSKVRPGRPNAGGLDTLPKEKGARSGGAGRRSK